MKTKVLSLEELAARARDARAAGRALVATNGCFDILHVGHVRYLAKARELGDELAVGLNSDASVRVIKGGIRPINSECDRAEVLAALECVNFVAIFPDLRATRFLQAAAPAVYVKGGDYTPETLDREEREALGKINTKIFIIPFEAAYSTTALVEKIKST